MVLLVKFINSIKVTEMKQILICYLHHHMNNEINHYEFYINLKYVSQKKDVSNNDILQIARNKIDNTDRNDILKIERDKITESIRKHISRL